MGKFENDIESKLGSFNLTPSEHVWEGVEAALHEKKKRRFAIWWWIPVAGILLLGAGWWVLDTGSSNDQQANQLTAATSSDKQKNITAIKEERKDAVETAKTVEGTTGNDNVNNKKKILSHGHTTAQSTLLNGTVSTARTSHKKPAINKAVAATNTVGSTSTGEATTIEPVEATKTVIAATTQEGNIQGTTVVKTTQATVDSLAKKDSTTAIAKNLLQKKDSSAIVALIDSIKKKAKKQQHQWMVTAGGGLSLVKGNNLLSPSSYDNAAFSNTVGSPPVGIGSGQSNMGAPSLPLPNTGFFLLAGVAYQGSISKHWSGNIGLQYRYIQQKQLKDSLINHSHWLNLPVNLQYTINPNNQVKYGLQIGGSVTWAFSQKWAYTPPSGYYYYDKALENKIILGLNAGAFVKMKNGLTLTLTGEQSLSPIHRASNNKYYWRQWSAQVSLPLNLLHKPKN